MQLRCNRSVLHGICAEGCRFVNHAFGVHRDLIIDTARTDLQHYMTLHTNVSTIIRIIYDSNAFAEHPLNDYMCSITFERFWHSLISKQLNQPTCQPTNQPTTQPNNPIINQLTTKLTNRSAGQPNGHIASRTNTQPTN